jgi:hypothetical protein
MKKILLLSLLLAIPFSLFAGKRLTTLTHTSKSSSESGVFTYDEEDRICQLDLSDSRGRSSTCTYTYGDSRIELYHTDGNKTVVYELEDGKVKTMTVDWPAEYVTVKDEFFYEGDKLVKIILYSEGENEYNDITWNGDNIAEYYHISGEGTNKEAWKKLTFTHSELSSTPLVNTLFDWAGSTSPNFNDFIYVIGFYKYIGTTPKNLFATTNHDSDEKPQGLYTYQYDTNADGDVVKVTITREKDGSTNVYDLEWEDAPDGIGTVSADPVATDSYTLNGIRLQGAPAQRGVYIRNGRKMIVK